MSKRLIVLIVGLFLITGIVLAGVFVFRVESVIVDFDTESTVSIDDGDVEKVIDASGIKVGKNIFSISESSMVKNITNGLSDVRVLNIERQFPNKVVIHVTKRVPVYLIAYRVGQNESQKYVLVDGDMIVIEFVDTIPNGDYITIDGFELMGRYTLNKGEVIPVSFGDEIYYMQNIAAGIYNDGLNPMRFKALVNSLSFDHGVIDVHMQSGVTLRLGSGLTTNEVSERIVKAYDWYSEQTEGSDTLVGGVARYNTNTDKFVWNND